MAAGRSTCNGLATCSTAGEERGAEDGGSTDHPALAAALRRRVLEGPGEIAPALRQAIARSVTGGAAAPPPCDALARQIGEAANRTTADDVASVVSATGSEPRGESS